MPYLRHTSPADSPAACSFRTLMICSSVNLLLRICPSPNGNGLYPKAGAFKGSRSFNVTTYRIFQVEQRDIQIGHLPCVLHVALSDVRTSRSVNVPRDGAIRFRDERRIEIVACGNS